jgi:hypothetical protein
MRYARHLRSSLKRQLFDDRLNPFRPDGKPPSTGGLAVQEASSTFRMIFSPSELGSVEVVAQRSSEQTRWLSYGEQMGPRAKREESKKRETRLLQTSLPREVPASPYAGHEASPSAQTSARQGMMSCSAVLTR